MVFERGAISFVLHLLGVLTSAKCENNSHPCHFLISLTRNDTLEHRYEINIKNLKNLRVLRFVLSEENLGLDGNVYKDLISNITDVHHLAARVNFSDSYGTLRETNVLGVVNMIKLAVVAQNTQRQSVRFHYYSTTDVLPFRTDASVEKLPTPELLRVPRGGYPQTKYVGEILISRIHMQGLQCT